MEALAAARGKEALAASPSLLVGYTEHPGNMHRRDPWGIADEFQRLAAEPWGLDQRAFAHLLATKLLGAGDRRGAAAAYARSARRHVVASTTPLPPRRACFHSETR